VPEIGCTFELNRTAAYRDTKNNVGETNKDSISTQVDPPQC
jgi:hypothetical protein